MVAQYPIFLTFGDLLRMYTHTREIYLLCVQVRRLRSSRGVMWREMEFLRRRWLTAWNSVVPSIHYSVQKWILFSYCPNMKLRFLYSSILLSLFGVCSLESPSLLAGQTVTRTYIPYQIPSQTTGNIFKRGLTLHVHMYPPSMRSRWVQTFKKVSG